MYSHIGFKKIRQIDLEKSEWDIVDKTVSSAAIYPQEESRRGLKITNTCVSCEITNRESIFDTV